MPALLLPIVKESLGITLSKFEVTDKSKTRMKRKRDLRSMLPFLILIVLSCIGILRMLLLLKTVPFMNIVIILFWLIRNMYFYVMSLFLIDGRDSDEEDVRVIDAELLTVTSSRDQKVYDGVTSQLTRHNIRAFFDEGGLRIGDYVEISVSGDTASAALGGVVIASKELRHSEGKTVTIEIIDFKESELEYMQILYDRIPSLPQSLTLRDFNIISHLWHNIVVRLQGGH